MARFVSSKKVSFFISGQSYPSAGSISKSIPVPVSKRSLTTTDIGWHVSVVVSSKVQESKGAGVKSQGAIHRCCGQRDDSRYAGFWASSKLRSAAMGRSPHDLIRLAVQRFSRDQKVSLQSSQLSDLLMHMPNLGQVFFPSKYWVGIDCRR